MDHTKGCHLNLLESFQITLEPKLEAQKINDNNMSIMLKYGFDGSGTHAIYHHKNNEKNKQLDLGSVFYR